MPKLQKLADLTPFITSASLASNDASPLVPLIEKELLAMIKQGRWDNYPIRLPLLDTNVRGYGDLLTRLTRRTSQVKKYGRLEKFVLTFTRGNLEFPHFVARVASTRLPDEFTCKLESEDLRNPTYLLINLKPPERSDIMEVTER